MNGRKTGKMDRWTDERKEGSIDLWMDGWREGKEGEEGKQEGNTEVRMHRWMDG